MVKIDQNCETYEITTFFLFVASAGNALECYSCDYEDEKKNCKGEGIDPAKYV